MSQTVSREEGLKRRLKELYLPIAPELARVEEKLRAELSHADPFVDQLAKHSFRLGGKRLRPALVLLSAKACGESSEEHIVLSVVVEMIHTATLVHDDILDDAHVRRHMETINARWNNQSSVLLGDYLFTHAFYLASTLGSTFACRQIGRSTNQVCEGEIRQIGARGNFKLTEEQYVQLIEAKTAVLCACCCRLGAHYAGADDEMTEAAWQYGLNLGIAFQIVDDILDLIGDEESMGKSLGTDLDQLKLTLPLIRLLQQLPLEAREELVEKLQQPEEDKVALLAPYLRESDALEYSKQQARAYTRKALLALESLPDNRARDVLREFASFVVDRRY